MIQFIVGVVAGIVIATIGVSGVAKLADKGVAKVQEVAKDSTKSDTVTEVKDAVKDTAKKAIDQVAK